VIVKSYHGSIQSPAKVIIVIVWRRHDMPLFGATFSRWDVG